MRPTSDPSPGGWAPGSPVALRELPLWPVAGCHALRGAYEGDPPERVSSIAALVTRGATGRNEALGFIEPQRRNGYSAASRQLADGQLLDTVGDVWQV